MTFSEREVGAFTEAIANGSSTPGGGSAAAVGGAIAAALAEMVCNVTVGKDEHASVESDLRDAKSELDVERRRLLELADEDADAVETLMEAYRTRDDVERTTAIEGPLREATSVPVEIAECCLAVLEHASVVAAKGDESAVTDAGASAFLAHAALQAALDTVAVNLASVDDDEFTAETERRVRDLRDAGDTLVAETRSTVENRM